MAAGAVALAIGSGGAASAQGLKAQLVTPVEVTQGVQNPQNGVDLVAERATWVRAYPQFNSEGTLTVQGRFRVHREGLVWDALTDPVTVSGSPDKRVKLRRDDFASSLNLRLPPELSTAGSARIELAGIVDAVTRVPIACPTCVKFPAEVKFRPATSLRVRAIGFRSAKENGIRRPVKRDFERLRQWLRRAYPVTDVQVDWVVMNAPFTPVLGDTACRQLNRWLARIRALDLQGGQDPRVRYYGLVADNGRLPRSHMRGCASGITDEPDPGIVASGPFGVPNVAPDVYGWDRDSTYGDWYAGHELAHTFGRRHTRDCNGKLGDDPDYPFKPSDKGGIGDETTDNQGLDFVDGQVRLLARQTSGDLMTYCENLWLSSYVYEGILNRLAQEDEWFRRGELGRISLPGPGLDRRAGEDSLLNVLVRVSNVAAGRGALQGVFPVPERGRPPAMDSAMVQGSMAGPHERRVAIELIDRARSVIYSRRSWIRLNNGLLTTDDGKPTIIAGTVSAYLPNLQDAAFVRIRYRGVTMDSVRVDSAPPRLLDGFEPKRAGARVPLGGRADGGIRFQWRAHDPPPSKPVTYFMQFTDDDVHWLTNEVTNDSTIDFDLATLGTRSRARIRIIASDGKNTAELFRSCDLVNPEPDCR